MRKHTATDATTHTHAAPQVQLLTTARAEVDVQTFRAPSTQAKGDKGGTAPMKPRNAGATQPRKRRRVDAN